LVFAPQLAARRARSSIIKPTSSWRPGIADPDACLFCGLVAAKPACFVAHDVEHLDVASCVMASTSMRISTRRVSIRDWFASRASDSLSISRIAWAGISPLLLPSLLEALKHPEWLVRLHAVEALGKSKSVDAVEPLLWVLFNDPDQAIREDVIRALGQLGDGRALEFLVAVMKEPGLRPLAVDAMGKIGDRRAVQVLVAVLEGGDRPVVSRTVAGCGDSWSEEMETQGAAVRALGSLGDESAIPVLLKALEQTVTRADAAAALTRFGSKVIAPLLTIMTQTSDENLRFHVKDALAKVGWRAGRI